MKMKRKETKQTRQIKPKEIKQARHIMRMAFKRDPDFKSTYIANVAMHLYDHYQNLDFEVRDIRESAAEGIIDLIFSK